MRVQENKGWDGYGEAQNWDAGVLDTPEDDDVEECVCSNSHVRATLEGVNVPKRRVKSKMSHYDTSQKLPRGKLWTKYTKIMFSWKSQNAPHKVGWVRELKFCTLIYHVSLFWWLYLHSKTSGKGHNNKKRVCLNFWLVKHEGEDESDLEVWFSVTWTR